MAGNGDAWVGLIQFLIVVVFVVLSLLGKVLTKVLGTDKEKEQQRQREAEERRRKAEAGRGQSGAPDPHTALEQFFQEAKRKKEARARQAAAAAGAPGGGQPSPLDDFPGAPGARPAHAPAAAAAPVPVARTAKATRRTAPRSATRPTAAAPSPYGGEAVAKARATIARANKRKRRVVRRVPQPSPAKIRFEELKRPLNRYELARAVLYAEILGTPRAAAPYSGPPAAG
jgi:hypothetical protein